MSFHSFSEFLAMGGHAKFVWLSYGMSLLVLGLVLLQPLQQRRRIIREQAQRLRRDEAPTAEMMSAEPLNGETRS